MRFSRLLPRDATSRCQWTSATRPARGSRQNSCFWRMASGLLPVFFAAQAIALAPPQASAEEWIIFGSSVAEQSVAVVRFNSDDMSLRLAQRVPLGFVGRALAYSPKTRRLYVSPNGKATEHHGAVFEVADDGRVTKVQSFPQAHGYDYLSFSPDERFLLGVSYFEGHVDVYAVDEDGAVGEIVCSVHEGRDKAHSVLVTPSNRFAYVPYVKDQNGLYQYSFDKSSGKLERLEPAEVDLPANIGPRHMVFHPRRRFVFFSNEQQLGVTSYRAAANGKLELIQVCEPLDFQPEEGLAASDIVITPNGRNLYVGVRGFGKELNAVFHYRVNRDGKLQAIAKTATDKIPWALAMAPDGKTLFVSATEGKSLTAFAVEEDGQLAQVARLAWGGDFRDLHIIRAAK